MLQVSIIPVREALRSLESEGLAVTRPGRKGEPQGSRLMLRAPRKAGHHRDMISNRKGVDALAR